MGDIVTHPRSGDDYFGVCQDHVIRLKNRDAIVQPMRDPGVEVVISWRTPIHERKALNPSYFPLPKTERVADEVVTLPMYPELTDQDVGMVIDTAKKKFA